MHKVLLLLVLFAAVDVALCYNLTLPCMSVQCVPQGGNCTWDGVAGHNPLCDTGSYCNILGNNTCVSYVPIGSACHFADFCAEDGVCYNGTCQTVSNNQFAGQSCSPISNCQNQFFCKSQICTAYPSKGQNCTGQFSCAAGLSCNFGTDSHNGVCIDSFSVAEGGVCSTHSISIGGYPTVSEECAAGLFCGCNYTNTSQACVCTKGFASSVAPCSDASPCANYNEICVCNRCQAPVTATAAQADAIINLGKCIAKDNCDQNQPEKCCRKYQCAAHGLYEAVYGKQFSKDNASCMGSDPYHFCDSIMGRLTTGEKIAIAAGVIVGVVLLVAIIVCCVRRRRHNYSTL